MTKYWKQYIVPFYGYTNNSSERNLIGSAFIIQPNYLITAAHNVMGEIGNQYKNKGVYYKNIFVELTNCIHIESNKGLNINKGVWEDLAIYDLRGNIDLNSIQNAFELSSNEVDVAVNYRVYGYDENTPINEPKSISTYTSINQKECSYTTDNKYTKVNIITNCFEIEPIANPGYSGCPVFKDCVVYGMVISDISMDKGNGLTSPISTRAIKSSYIQNIINNLF